MAKAKTTGSKAELAALLGLSRGRITQLIKKGLPVRRDGRVDKAEAVAWYRANFPKGPLKTGPKKVSPPVISAPTPSTGEDFMGARTRKEIALANLRSLEASRMQGTLIDAGEAKRAWAGMISAARSRFLGLPGKCAVYVAGSSDPVECQAILEKEVREALKNLAEYKPAATAAKGAL